MGQELPEASVNKIKVYPEHFEHMYWHTCCACACAVGGYVTSAVYAYCTCVGACLPDAALWADVLRCLDQRHVLLAMLLKLKSLSLQLAKQCLPNRKLADLPNAPAAMLRIRTAAASCCMGA